MKKIKPIAIDVISYLFIGLFLYAAASKLMSYYDFKSQISKSPIITDYADTLVWLIPLLEIIICGLLFSRKTLLIGLYASTILMWIFTVYVFAILNLSVQIPCACGGVFNQMSWNQHLIFNIAFVGLGFAGIFLKSLPDKSISKC